MIGFQSILTILGITVATVLLLRRFNVPPILGYLLTGILVGPYTTKILQTTVAFNHIAEFGIVFLLFTIGLELSLSKLISMRRSLLGLGGLQVGFCVAITLLIATYLQLDWPTAITIAGALTLSSTAVVTKLLIDQHELHQEHGKLCLSILLFQDLATIPFLIIVPSFAQNINNADMNLTDDLFYQMLIGVLVVIAMLAIGRWLLRPMFHFIAAARSTELFMLSTLLTVLISAFITEYFCSSLALGAFLSGVMLAETEYVHQVETDILPFRDLLLGFFFITIGMRLNPQILIDDWFSILSIMSIMVLVKILVVAFLAMMMGTKIKPAIRTGLILAQGGEFGFALLTIAHEKSIVDPHTIQIIIAVIIISMSLAPFLIRNNLYLAKKLSRFKKHMPEPQDYQSILTDDQHHSYKNHVIICGYGRAGQTLARFLDHQGTPFIGLDIDPLRLQEARTASEPVFFGNPFDESVLKAAGIDNTKLLILTFKTNIDALKKMLYMIRRINKELPVLIRTEDDRHLETLQLAGATEVIPEQLESSLMLAAHMLVLLGVPQEEASRRIFELKANRYTILRGYFQSHKTIDSPVAQNTLSLHAIELTPQAYAVGKTLEEFCDEKMPIQLASFSRNGYKCETPTPHTVLQAEDILVLLATTEEHAKAEAMLLYG